MGKCQACKAQDVEWAWQPFGPGSRTTFTTLGSHYRGFLVVKVCDTCKRDFLAGQIVDFTCNGARFIGDKWDIRQVPAYVEDALAWLEDVGAKGGGE